METGDSDVLEEARIRFADRVGWYKNGQWVWYENLDFSLNAPYGHLPLGNGRNLFTLINRFSRIANKDLPVVVRQPRTVDDYGKQQYGESEFSPGQNVVCLVEGWKYSGQVGIVERAVNRKFVEVRFDDSYLTTQSDDKFKLAQ